MKLSRTIALLAAVLSIVFVSAGSASAGTFDPTYRGDDNSVHAIFDWVSNQQSAWATTLFDSVPASSSPFPLSTVTPGVSDDGLDTTIVLPNFIDPLPLKKMRIQMLFDGPVSGDLMDIDILAFDTEQTSWQVVGGSGPGDSAEHYVDIEIIPNPDSEEIIIFGNQGGNLIPGNLLRIEVDTVSVPEPATMALLGLGGLALLRRKRR